MADIKLDVAAHCGSPGRAHTPSPSTVTWGNTVEMRPDIIQEQAVSGHPLWSEITQNKGPDTD